MSQTPHPHDPYGTEPGSAVPEQPATSEGATSDGLSNGQPPQYSAPAEQSDVAPESDATQPAETSQPGPAGDQELGSPTSDPALHPHDPYAYEARAQEPGASADAEQFSPPSPYGSPSPASGGGQDPYAVPSSTDGQDPFAAPSTGAAQGGFPGGPPGHTGAPGPNGAPGQHGSQDQYGGPGQYGASGQQQHAPQGPVSSDVPPAGIKGTFNGPLSGQPMEDSDAKTWALVVHLAALLQFVIPFIGGLIAQIVLYVIFKDRNRFVRYNAAEALNGTIAALIISLVMGAIFTVITIVTFGIGAFLFGLMFIPTVVQAIFAIIGAVKAYQGEWWNYPANIRLVK